MIHVKAWWKDGDVGMERVLELVLPVLVQSRLLIDRRLVLEWACESRPAGSMGINDDV